MRATSEELALVFIHELSFSQLLSSLFLFPSSCIGKKQSFNKAFNINSWLLAKDCTRKEVDLSFINYYYFSVVKTNSTFQHELLINKLIYLVKAIPVAVAIFCNFKFLLCTRNTLNFTKKLRLKIKNLRVNIIKEWIEQIWAYKIIAKLNLFFTKNSD